MQNSNLWELALVAQALTNRQESLKSEYKQTKDKELIEEMHVVKHNLRLINKQLAKNSKK
jgi:hypothetical protein